MKQKNDPGHNAGVILWKQKAACPSYSLVLKCGQVRLSPAFGSFFCEVGFLFVVLFFFQFEF